MIDLIVANYGDGDRVAIRRQGRKYDALVVIEGEGPRVKRVKRGAYKARALSGNTPARAARYMLAIPARSAYRNITRGAERILREAL